ncbi:MAG: rod shape-determining protein RodA [Saprospiraceae bacterium]
MSTLSLSRKESIKVDWITLVTFFCLLLIGWMMIYASGFSELTDRVIPFFKTNAGKQLIAIIISAFIFLIVFITDSKFWSTLAYPIYLVALLLLILVIFIGQTIKGSTSWFNLGGLSFQPSEFGKFGTMLAMAAYISYYKTNLKQPRSRLIAMAIVFIPVGLILLQPDAGSALTYSAFFVLFFREGFNPVWYIVGLTLLALFILALKFEPFYVVAYLICIGSSILFSQLKRNNGHWAVLAASWGVLIASYWFKFPITYILVPLSIGLMYFIFNAYVQRLQRLLIILVPSILLGATFTKVSQYSVDHFLRPHQQDRINVWLRPEKCDPRGNLYHVMQSKLAISSGNLYGKGFLAGTLTKLNYVPEQSTDFIFSIVGEEQGFMGIIAIIGLFVLLMFRTVIIGERAKNTFTRVYAYSYLGFIMVHFFINIGMTMGLVPIMGIPLPFISYGGTSCMVFSLMTALLIKLDTSRHFG